MLAGETETGVLLHRPPHSVRLQKAVYLQSRSYQDLPSAVVDLLRAGGSFSFVLNHHHTGLALLQTHPARLTFASSGLRYTPEGNCNTKEFAVPLATVRSETRATPDGYHFLTFSLPSPSGDKKILTMNFIDDNSGLAAAIVNISTRANRLGAR